MTESTDLPKVLFVTSHAFNHTTGGGVTFSNLFSGWPKDRLATLHNDPLPPETDVCENYFKISSNELGKWGPFRLLQSPPQIRSAPQQIAMAETPPFRSGLLTQARSLVFGVNEFPETAKLSPELEAWIDDFAPQVLYTILGGNGFMDLVELIRVRFNLPLVVHIMDDWRTNSHAKGLLAPLRKQKMHRQLNHFMTVASHCMGISDTMCAAYGAEYNRPFETFHNGIETKTGNVRPAADKKPGEPFKIFYGGAVLPFAQLQSIIDVCEATARLNDQGQPVRFDIFCPPAMTDPHREKLLTCDAVHLHPPLPRREDYLATLHDADLLLLPVNFSDETIKFIHYSMPTKVPEMMQSGVPVLVYGPAGVAQVDYACEHGWGYPVTERGVENVAAAIKKLMTEAPLRQQLTAKARQLAEDRHDIKTVRAQFRAALSDAAA